MPSNFSDKKLNLIAYLIYISDFKTLAWGSTKWQNTCLICARVLVYYLVLGK